MDSEKQRRDAEILDQIRIKFGGESSLEVKPDWVLAEAEDPGHVWHNHFEWDDRKAGHAHRVAQARALIARIKVEIRTTHKTYIGVGYVRNPFAAKKSQSMVAVSLARRNKETALALVRQELDRCESSINRGRAMAEVLGLSELFQELLERIVIIKKRLDGRKRKAKV